MHSRTIRRAAIVVETLVALPVLLIAILAVVELGQLSSNQMVVQAASRAGADVAALMACDLPTEGAIPDEIIDAVAGALDCKDISNACIRLEHSIGDAPPYVLTFGTAAEPPVTSPPADHDYVCVSVCVENTELAPNLLRTFCIDLEGSYSQKSVCRCASCDDDDPTGGGGDPVKIGSGFIPGTSGGADPLSNPATSTIRLVGGGGGNMQVMIFDDNTWMSNDGSWEGTWAGDPTSSSVNIVTAMPG